MSLFRIMAVDPGVTGAIAWLDFDANTKRTTLLDVQDLPAITTKVRGGKNRSRLDAQALVKLLKHNPDDRAKPVVCVVEAVGPGPRDGKVQAFAFGRVAGVIDGALAGAGVPQVRMRTNEWQPLAGLVRGPEFGRDRAAVLFPEQKQLFKRVKDHNRADAALIGYAFFQRCNPVF